MSEESAFGQQTKKCTDIFHLSVKIHFFLSHYKPLSSLSNQMHFLQVR